MSPPLALVTYPCAENHVSFVSDAETVREIVRAALWGGTGAKRGGTGIVLLCWIWVDAFYYTDYNLRWIERLITKTANPTTLSLLIRCG